MPDQTTLPFYKAYVTNVSEFKIAEKEIRRIINRALKENKTTTINTQTKLYALLYSTYSEAAFMKMILTPYGFEQEFVNQILAQGSIQEKWFKCVDLAFNKFSKHKKGSEIPNKSLELKKIINEYIIDPSIIRNKIAHGQISVALNSKNTSLHIDITNKLNNLDVVYISRLFYINDKLTSIIEDLIESPDKAHYEYYFAKFQDLENYIEKSKNWSILTKMKTKSMSKKIIR